MLTVKDVDEQVYRSLQHLAPKVYKIEREQVGETVTYTVYKDGEMMGKYQIMPGDADKSNTVYFAPTYAPDDYELNKEWDEIVNTMLWGDIARRWGECVHGWGMRGWIEQPTGSGTPPTVTIEHADNVQVSQYVYQTGTVNQASMGDITTGGDVTGRDKVTTKIETKQ